MRFVGLFSIELNSSSLEGWREVILVCRRLVLWMVSWDAEWGPSWLLSMILKFCCVVCDGSDGL